MAFAKISNMKTLFLSATILTLVFTACKNNGDSADSGDIEQPDQKKISKRDLSINASSAYNDIFLDSMALESYITEEQVDAEIARRLRSFYNARNYQFAWFSSDGLTEQARGFWNLHDYATTYGNDTTLKDKTFQKRMDRLIAEETLSVGASDKSFINTEFKLTQHFIQYTLNAYDAGYVKRKEMERFIPIKKQDALAIADSLLNKKHKDNKYFEDVNDLYKRLKDQLGRYYGIAKNGGWQPVPVEEKVKEYKVGMTGPVVLGIKKRLQATGEMPAGDTSQVFSDTLANAVMAYQQQLGYTPNGVVTKALIKEMNTPINSRIQQILINMDRMRWMPSQPKGNLIQVNIPEFMLHVMENGKKVFVARPFRRIFRRIRRFER